jgi:hypothetical protein
MYDELPRNVATLPPDQTQLFNKLLNRNAQAVLCYVFVYTHFDWAHGGNAGVASLARNLETYGRLLVEPEQSLDPVNESWDPLYRMFIAARSCTVMGWPSGRRPSAHQATFRAASHLCCQIKKLLGLRTLRLIQVDGAWRPMSEPWCESELIEAIETHFFELRKHLLTLPSPRNALVEWLGEIEFEYCRVADRILSTAALYRAGRPDEKPDGSKEKFVRLPRNQDVIRLAKAIKSPKNLGRPMIDIALEITQNNETRAESLVRKLRDYRHLLEP